MSAREELEELASFWAEEGDALSFYLAAFTPTELAHREEPILAKEKIQEVFGSLQGGTPAVRADIQRLLDLASASKGNHARGKVVFACGRKKFWREYDVASSFATSLGAGQSFTLAPMAGSLAPRRRYCVALADRNRSRLLLLEDGRIQEHTSALDEELDPELDKVRTTGTGGSSHLERQREEMARQHFRFLASHLFHFYEHKDFERLVIGCRDAMWPEIEEVLHPELKRILVGHFRIDPGLATAEEVQSCAQKLIDEENAREEEALLQSARDGAAAQGLGAVGVADVLQAMERGEIRTLLWPGVQTSSGAVSSCRACGHYQMGRVATCELCAQPTVQYPDVGELLVRGALSQNFDLRVVGAGGAAREFAAVLRFRSDHSTAQELAS